MNSNDFKKNYINHYLLLEREFEATKPYVTVAKDNFDTYSAEYLKLILSIGSEIDVMLETVAKEYDPQTRESGFGYSKVILSHEPDIKKLEIMLRDENITVMPWECNNIPNWWTAYNEIKHHRDRSAELFDSDKKYYQYANQKNVLYSLAALYSLEMYGYRITTLNAGEEMFVPTIKTMFSIKNSHWTGVTMGNSGVLIGESLYMI